MPLLTPDQRNGAWHDARRGRITASIAAACLGLDPHRSPREAWRLITGRKPPPEDNVDMAFGRAYEGHAVAAWERETGLLAWPTGFWVHPDLPWLGASPDGLVGDDAVLECKCPRSLPTAVPAHHRVQMLVQCACTGRDVGHYCAWAGDSAVYVDRVTFSSAEIVATLTDLEAWRDAYLLTDIEPPVRRKRKETA